MFSINIIMFMIIIIIITTIIIKVPVMFTNYNVKQSFQSNTSKSELYPEFAHTHRESTPALHTVCLSHTCDDQIPGIVLINALKRTCAGLQSLH